VKSILRQVISSLKSAWPDAWMSPEVEVLAGCVLLVFSGWWWFVPHGAIWDGWKNILATITVVLGPWLVYRAWHRKMLQHQQDQTALEALLKDIAIELDDGADSGAASGIIGNILALIGDRERRKSRERVSFSLSPSTLQMVLDNVEGVLREHSAAEFETTDNAAYESVYVVSSAVENEDWRAGYDSLESFYVAHEARHPDIRVYAAVAQSLPENSDPESWPSELIVQRIAQLTRNVIVQRIAQLARDRSPRAAPTLHDTSEDRRTVEEHLFETSEDYRAAAEELLGTSEDMLRSNSPADFETTPDAYELVYMVEDGENWRAGYDSLESFYAAHEERHPEVRQYAARARGFLDDREEVLRENSPADFQTEPYAAIDCIAAAHAIVDRGVWRTGYDSLESFYGAHEAHHPDIRVYAAVYWQGYAESARGDPLLGPRIAQRIADRR
jgi:hypothetical protein